MGASLKLMGAKELDKILKELPKTTAQNVAKRAMTAALQPVLQAAIDAAPVERGNLKESMAVSSKLTPSQAKGARGTRAKDVVTMYVGPSAPHAHLVEFGTGPRRQKNGRYVGRMPPQPFMRPAWDANREAVLDSLTAAIGAEIDKVLARRAKRAAKAAG